MNPAWWWDGRPAFLKFGQTLVNGYVLGIFTTD
jgi:hypothetical protein